MTRVPATEDAAALGADHRLSHRQILLVLSGLMAGMLLAALDQTIVAPRSRRSSVTWVGSTICPGW
jgi:hypothetical protein